MKKMYVLFSIFKHVYRKTKQWVVVYFIKALFGENSSNNSSKAVKLIIL